MQFRTRTSAISMPKGEVKRDVLLRMAAFVWHHYRWHMLLVLLGVVVASLTSLVSSLFTRTLIDDYILLHRSTIHSMLRWHRLSSSWGSCCCWAPSVPMATTDS